MNVNPSRHLPFPVSPKLNTFFNERDSFSILRRKSDVIYIYVKYFTLRLKIWISLSQVLQDFQMQVIR